MINLTNYSYSNNILNFKSKNKKENEQPKTQINKPNNNFANKAKTGLLVTSAFLAGLGVDNVITSSKAGELNTTIQATPVNDVNANGKTITYEEAQAQTKSKTQNNIPPKKGFREYISTEQQTINGVNYTVKSKYRVKEYPFLMEQTYTNNETKKVEEIAKFKDYTVFPLYNNITKEDGSLIHFSEFTDFNFKYNMPKKAIIKDKMTDGSTVTQNVKYSISISSTTDAAKKPQNNTNNNNKPQEKEEDEFKEWIDFMDRIGI